MEILDEINKNFLGVPYSDQKRIIDYLKKTITDNNYGKTAKELLDFFEETFSCYSYKLDCLLIFKEKYKNFNSKQRRLVRKIMLSSFISTIENHHSNNSEENIFRSYINYYDTSYSYKTVDDFKLFFKPNKIDTNKVNIFFEKFNSLNIEEKFEFIKNLSTSYSDLLSFYRDIPVKDDMLKEYEPIVQNIIGDDMMNYYDALYPQEKIDLILVPAEKIYECEKISFGHSYKYYIDNLEDDPNLIREIKKEINYKVKFFM